ncbi:hypothetical protein AG1IA_00075 [Rhizoctonia solani AG-1 IA]|uniref:Uncharacterized protein n=1 Tax=Thanatephorus cucumeris (strain AG1-IA) TaxID=983506 RepID=L8XB26_THACA|nr:hypothetical protein AG1IA_00075 [Rhizoctonia solani AG-1 IA]
MGWGESEWSSLGETVVRISAWIVVLGLAPVHRGLSQKTTMTMKDRPGCPSLRSRASLRSYRSLALGSQRARISFLRDAMAGSAQLSSISNLD